MSDYTALQESLKKADLDTIKALIKAQPDLINKKIDQGGGNETCLLVMLIQRRMSDAAIYLLEQGADPTNQPVNTINALLNAVSYGKHANVDVLKALAKAGARLELNDEYQCKNFIRHSLKDLYQSDDMELLQELVALGFDPVATEQAAGIPILGCAFQELATGPKWDDSRVVHWLIQQGCDKEFRRDRNIAPLRTALLHRRYKWVERLLDNGVSPEPILDELPFQVASPYNEIPDYLLERIGKADLDFTARRRGKTALHHAAAYGNDRFIDFAANKKADLNARDDAGDTALIAAIRHKAKSFAILLVERGADINLAAGNGDTPLDIALSLPGNKRLCADLIKMGAKTSLEVNATGSANVNKMDVIRKAIQPGEPWADYTYETICNQNDEKLALWSTLVRLCLDNNSAKPSRTWLKEANALIDAIGQDHFREFLLVAFQKAKEKRTAEAPKDDGGSDNYYKHDPNYISENNTRLLRALAWTASRYATAQMSRTLREFAAAMYKKVAGVGMRNAKTANAAILALAEMPGTVGLKEVVILRAATKYNPALVNINRVFNKMAESRNLSADELAELSTPDYGLTEIGKFKSTLGEYQAELSLTAVGKTLLIWSKDGKPQKSAPASVKSTHGNEVKAITAMAKDLQVGSSAHNQRLEQLYLRNHSLSMETWREQYVDHKLIGFLARRLIWQLKTGSSTINVIFGPDGYVDCQNRVNDLPDQAEVSLWHPIMSSVEEVLLWRTWLIEQGITQPFKQAHREIYILTDAERQTETYSMRFANHLLLQHQFHALATQRGWKQTRGGSWDGGQENSATKSVPAHDVHVEFDATGSEAYGFGHSGMYECVATGKVIFRKGNSHRLEELDPLLFSEAMRDVDLFVGVCSIGNDPNWRDRENQYWQRDSFGNLNATAETRRDVLAALIPKLKIAPQLELEDRFLIVKGSIRTYKIHLGSSNILMEPNNSYLCIVESSTKEDIMLPFEGDRILSLVLSKALLLANDKKIKDPTILSQINHRGAA